MNKEYNKELKKIDKIITRLKNKIVKNGYYEDLGQKELREYLDTINISNYNLYCNLKDYFNRKIEEL
jgi:hypothetical protein